MFCDIWYTNLHFFDKGLIYIFLMECFSILVWWFYKSNIWSHLIPSRLEKKNGRFSKSCQLLSVLWRYCVYPFKLIFCFLFVYFSTLQRYLHRPQFYINCWIKISLSIPMTSENIRYDMKKGLQPFNDLRRPKIRTPTYKRTAYNIESKNII